jgi:NAD(P)H-hydrate repair Nnr-like enzyme with NAD(P)H-hydrate dehydratase domain
LDAGAARDAAADARCDVLLIGTGATDTAATSELVRMLLPELDASTSVVVDASAIASLSREPELVRAHEERAVVMPNPSEMAKLLGVDVEWVDRHPDTALDQAIDLLGTVVALRGPETTIGSPDGLRFIERSGPAELGTAGSGDVLAGILCGLLARGTSPLAATMWSVHVHALAGRHLANGRGYAGILARDLLDAIPHAFERAASMPCDASD